jgi:hypothetical protein
MVTFVCHGTEKQDHLFFDKPKQIPSLSKRLLHSQRCPQTHRAVRIYVVAFALRDLIPYLTNSRRAFRVVAGNSDLDVIIVPDEGAVQVYREANITHHKKLMRWRLDKFEARKHAVQVGHVLPKQIPPLSDGVY